VIRKSQTKSILDSNTHRDAVHEFFDFFKLRTQSPRLEFLQEILDRFATIPYENISKIIKLNQQWDAEVERIRLPEEVIAHHIDEKLGGTCFSLTFYLQAILTQNNFRCYPVMADMRAGENIHCCLIVLLDGVKYLVDPGYLLTQPMEINPGKPKLFRTEFSGVELRYDALTQKYNLFTFDKNERKWRYCFRDRPTPADEFLQHWLASFGWNSMHGICLTRVLKGGLLYVHKTFMRETTFSEKKNYNIKRNYHAAIREHFGIEKEIVEQAQVALADNMKRERESGLWVPKEERVTT